MTTTDKSKSSPSLSELNQQERAAARRLAESVAAAKRLKAKSRDAKRAAKLAKKAAKQAAKVARQARKASEEARRLHRKAVARVEKAGARAAKEKKEVIVTPRKPARSGGTTRSPRGPERSLQRARASVRKVRDDAIHAEVPQVPQLGTGSPL